MVSDPYLTEFIKFLCKAGQLILTLRNLIKLENCVKLSFK